MGVAYILHILTLAGAFLGKWIFGILIGFSVFMALAYFGAWLYGREPDPNSLGIMFFISAGVIITLVFL